MQLAGGKLPDRLRHSRARARVADDPAGHRDRKNWDLKRNSEHGVRDGLHYEPARMSNDTLPTSLPNWKIKRPVARFLVAYSVIPVAVPSRQFPPPWSSEVQPKQLRRARRARYTRKSKQRRRYFGRLFTANDAEHQQREPIGEYGVG